MAKKKMTQEMIDNIQNYGSSIETLKDFITAVRQNVGMYIGSKGNKGFINMIREILQNSMDELNKDSSPCDFVSLSFDQRSNTVIVEDNGRGIPFDNIIRIFEDQHTSSNYKKRLYEYSSGLHGVGAKVTNALSSSFIVESYILGDARRVEFIEGYPWDKGEVKIPNSENKQGTRIIFTPSYDALGEINVSWESVYNLIKLIVPLAKIGAVVQFNAIDENGKEHKDTIVNQDGILTYLVNTCEAPIIKPIVISKDTGEMKMDIAFTYDIKDMGSENLVAFSNTCPTSSGTHINGFSRGVTYFFTNYMNKVYLAGNKKSKVTITSADIKSGLHTVISVAHLHPIFNGQAKEILANEDMEPFVKNGIMDLLNEWSKTNPNDLQKVCKYLKDVAEIRLKSDKEKVKLNTKYSSSSLTGLPSKYVAPTGKTDLELFICEGDSAAGILKNSRINARQGYFPIRGKIPNAFNTARDKFLSNAEIAGIINIIGGGYGRSFDITKVKWSKIIFAADADADGDHISALLERFFLLYMPELIIQGRVFKAQPPLFGLPGKGKKMTYFNYRIDYVKFIQKEFSKNNSVSYINGKELTVPELSKILYTNVDYTYEIEKIANRYATDPGLLESILLLRDKSINVMKANLKKVYRFIDVKDVNGIKMIDGVHDGKSQTVFVDRIVLDCGEILSIMDKNTELVYNVNGKPTGLYGMMHLFDESAPKSIQRYKGLGEMSEKKIFESTLDPEKRTLIKYTVEDIKKEIEEIKYYESNKNQLLTNVKVSRFDVMG